MTRTGAFALSDALAAARLPHSIRVRFVGTDPAAYDVVLDRTTSFDTDALRSLLDAAAAQKARGLVTAEAVIFS